MPNVGLILGQAAPDQWYILTAIGFPWCWFFSTKKRGGANKQITLASILTENIFYIVTELWYCAVICFGRGYLKSKRMPEDRHSSVSRTFFKVSTATFQWMHFIKLINVFLSQKNKVWGLCNTVNENNSLTIHQKHLLNIKKGCVLSLVIFSDWWPTETMGSLVSWLFHYLPHLCKWKQMAEDWYL